MNTLLAAEFVSLAADLMTEFGREATHTNSDGDEAAVLAVVRSEHAPVGDFGERMEPRTTISVAKSAAVAVGDTLHYAGAVTDEDPLPDDVVWTMAQIIEDDGYLVRFAVRQQ